MKSEKQKITIDFFSLSEFMKQAEYEKRVWEFPNCGAAENFLLQFFSEKNNLSEKSSKKFQAVKVADFAQ